MQVVWFKRDLRVHDNRVLSKAAARGDVLPLFVAEPELWQAPDMSSRQWAFVEETLQQLRVDLGNLGQPLVVRTGEVTAVLYDLLKRRGITALWSHEETGNDWTFQRDLRVAAWCRTFGVPWYEVQNHGVFRRLKSRVGWSQRWDSLMSEPVRLPPRLKPVEVDPGNIPTAKDLGILVDFCPLRQTGGRRAGLSLLDSFLARRAKTYRTAMSSPVEGESACSRLSPHLSWGTLSMREVTQANWARQCELRTTQSKNNTEWQGSLKSFNGRLHWHCHFIQKLEAEPSIEYANLHRGYDAIRPSEPDQIRLEAWTNGETGLPFLDACMRYLRASGWLNFRMRSMIMATASYHLWLDWRAPGLQLARYFTDYEPGIHWSQVQMQSGTTGINTVRIYNPVKQGYDQDPSGTFTRKWVPELAKIPDRFLHEPWKAENAVDLLGKSYPYPIVDHLSAAKKARQRIWAVRRGQAFRAEALAIAAKHASRKTRPANRKRSEGNVLPAQMTLPFEE
ncbi:FAD-binding domain-containing protein [Ruegeria arenilitoris]|uniref:FAD-binding domain-containing protein n=1 Tax=Ruegeria arenilitoris TaxID=1173585 RepID=UPI00147B7678|nr:deoxyribodipyrimidine photo-lyase [Ruegeria arenilitoris]